jgi:hypothetical protein
MLGGHKSSLIVAAIMRRGMMPGQGGTSATLVGQPVSGPVEDQAWGIFPGPAQGEINVIGGMAPMNGI